MASKKKTINLGTLEDLAIYFEANVSDQYDVDQIALNVMVWLKKRISSELWDLLHDMMLGFDEDMQLEIANNLWDFTCAHIIRTTGCISADTMLVYSYKLIAKEQGFYCKGVERVIQNARRLMA